MKFIATLNRLPPARRSILVEAAWSSFVACLMVRLLPYRFWKRWLGPPVSLSEVPEEVRAPKAGDDKVVIDIAWAHRRLSVHSKGVFTCLMLGFSARGMLRRRGIDSYLVLGVGRMIENGGTGLGAHAWVIYESIDIAGGGERHDYAPVAAYRTTCAT